jgi:hypothetical protein
VAPPRRPNVPIGVFGNLDLSSSLPLFLFFHSLTTFLSRSSSSSGAAAVMGAATADAVVGAAPGPAPISEPRTPEGVPEDVVAPEAVPEVFQEEVPTEGVMIAVRTAAAPPPSRGARAPLSSVPHKAATSGLPPVREWRWSWGIPPFTRRVTSP